MQTNTQKIAQNYEKTSECCFLIRGAQEEQILKMILIHHTYKTSLQSSLLHSQPLQEFRLLHNILQKHFHALAFSKSCFNKITSFLPWKLTTQYKISTGFIRPTISTAYQIHQNWLRTTDVTDTKVFLLSHPCGLESRWRPLWLTLVIIMIPLKGAIQDFCPGAIVCKSHATYQALVMCNMLSAMWYDGPAQLLSLTELKSHLL